MEPPAEDDPGNDPQEEAPVLRHRRLHRGARGRDVFCAELGRTLANRNALVVDPRALRRLDRTNCLVLAEDVVSQSRYTLHEFECLENYDLGDTRARLTEIFDADHALETQKDGEWSIQPLGLSPDISDALSLHAADLARRVI